MSHVPIASQLTIGIRCQVNTNQTTNTTLLQTSLTPTSLPHPQNQTKLNTTSTNPPPQPLQIPAVPPILPLVPLPLQQPDRPPHPVTRATLLALVSGPSTLFLSRSNNSTPPLHLHLPLLKRPIRRREIVQTLCGHGRGWEVGGCAGEVEEGGLKAVLLRGLRYRRSNGEPRRGHACCVAARAWEGGFECLGS